MGALDTRDYERGPQPSRSEAYGDPARLTMADRLEHQARSLPDRHAFSFVEDGGGVNTRTWAELATGASAVAAVLADLPRTREQPRALLLLPDDATFLDALFGCFYAGVCAVPAHVPIPSRLEQTLPRLCAIVADARPDVVLTTREILPARELVPALADIPCIAVDDLGLADGATASAPESTVSLEDLAILQYSSGSSGTPRGVMVSHANLMANEAMIEDAFGHTSSTVALGWLPFQHDMGLIGVAGRTSPTTCASLPWSARATRASPASTCRAGTSRSWAPNRCARQPSTASRRHSPRSVFAARRSIRATGSPRRR